MSHLLDASWNVLLQGGALGLLEGPRIEEDGAVLFSDVTGGGVFRLPPGGEPSAVVPRRRGVGGLVPHADGGVVVSGRDVLHAAPDGDRTLLALDGVAAFNDLSTDGEGRVLVGALRFAPMRGEAPVPGEVWRIGADGRAEPVAEGIDWPNGIGLSPAGDVLCVSDFQHATVLAFRPGSTRGEVFAHAPAGGSCDGLAVDAAGGVWVALGPAGAIARFRPDGALDAVLDVPADFVSSLCFGGPDGRDVVVTTIGALLTTRAALPGLPVAPARTP